MNEPRARARMLTAEIRRATSLRDQVVADGGDPSDLDLLLSDLHRKLGELMVDGAGGPPSADEPSRDQGWYDDDRTLSGDPGGPLFDAEDLQTGEIPIPDDLHLALEPDDTMPGQRYAVETASNVGTRGLDPRSGLGRFHRGSAPFAAELRQLLETLRSPLNLDDPAARSVEVSRLQWVAADFDRRTHPFPEDVQVALIGLLSARAQHLKARHGGETAVRQILERLEKFRVAEGLPSVHGLLPTPLPEGRSWLDDAEAWWFVLVGSDDA
jgi:hypothetical protein